MDTGFISKSLALRKPVKCECGKDRMKLDEPVIAMWEGKRIHVRDGYVTDGASIPRSAWLPVGNPWEEYLGAAIIHDWLYESEVWPREDADRCFVDLMEWLGINWARRNVMYSAVRLGGGFTWKKHTEASITLARQLGSVS
jgi:hypothetical protein